MYAYASGIPQGVSSSPRNCTIDVHGTALAPPAASAADHLTVPTNRPTSQQPGSASGSDPRLHPETKGTLCNGLLVREGCYTDSYPEYTIGFFSDTRLL
jgi:hypothetical protein